MINGQKFLTLQHLVTYFPFHKFLDIYSIGTYYTTALTETRIIPKQQPLSVDLVRLPPRVKPPHRKHKFNKNWRNYNRYSVSISSQHVLTGRLLH